jgi:hypothetical protein
MLTHHRKREASDFRQHLLPPTRVLHLLLEHELRPLSHVCLDICYRSHRSRDIHDCVNLNSLVRRFTNFYETRKKSLVRNMRRRRRLSTDKRGERGSRTSSFIPRQMS